MLLGAMLTGGQAHFRVWAPHSKTVDVQFDEADLPPFSLSAGADGYFSGAVGVPVGALYRYSLDGGAPLPDPCSRFQPFGPHGPSQLVDPTFAWTDAAWQGSRLPGQVIYELHIGTFTREGTFAAATQRLPYLRDLGATMVELLPIIECPGRWNWGYDGVQLFAPFHHYGDPDDVRRFVDEAHHHGIAVVLDVVYNHLGPDGNYLKDFSADYFSRKYRTEWGDAFNFDDERSRGARDLVIGNAKYWLQEFHFDGFRLDATQSIFDASEPHVLAQLTREARACVARDIVFIAENEPQRGEHLLPPESGGFGLDAMWNDDFHHSARVALTGSRDGYFHDYTGRAQELVSAVKRGFLYQGQYYPWQKQRRGSPLRHATRAACVHFLQNHDQVGNSGVGDRLHTLASQRRLRAATALLLLGPQTPLLFMGQEFMAATRFMFFADHKQDLREIVYRGRREFLAQFEAYATDAVQATIRDPGDERTFAQSKLDWDDLERNAGAFALHRDLLRLRREDEVFANQLELELDGATLSETAFVLRWFAPDESDRLLLVNLGPDAALEAVAEPLVAPPLDRTWEIVWASEDPRYGGQGVITPVTAEGQWRTPGECAVVLRARHDA